MSDSMKIVSAVRQAASFLQQMATGPSYYPQSDESQAAGIASQLKALRDSCGSRMSFVDELTRHLDSGAYRAGEAAALMAKRTRQAFSEVFPPTR